MWDDAAGYESYVGRWSRVVAPRFVEWLSAGHGLRWLDVGCGTGALMEAASTARPSFLVGVDASAAYLGYARRRLAGVPASLQIAKAESLPLAGRAFDLAVSGLALNFMPAAAALDEQTRVTVPGGLVAGYVWD